MHHRLRLVALPRWLAPARELPGRALGEASAWRKRRSRAQQAIDPRWRLQSLYVESPIALATILADKLIEAESAYSRLQARQAAESRMGANMLMRRLARAPAMIARPDDEADALIEAFGVGAYSEARRREHEASSDAIAVLWGRVAMKVAQLAGGLIEVADSAAPGVRAAPEALQAAHDQEQRPLAQTQPFRIQFVRFSSGRETSLLDEVQIEASDASAAIIAAACAAWPPQTKELRVLDRNGRQVFERKANGRQPSRGDCWAILPGACPDTRRQTFDTAIRTCEEWSE